MSAGKQSGLRPFNSTTAPRGGGKAGRKFKLTAEALRVIDRLLVDWKKHGANTLKILRSERPDLYARLCIETSTRLALAEMDADGLDGPTLLVVRWGEPKQLPAPPPLPPEKQWSPELSPPAPAMTQPASPRVLTLLPRQPV